MKDVAEDVKGIAGKARAQIVKDYVAWPLLSALVAGGVEFAIDRASTPTSARYARGPASSRRARRTARRTATRAWARARRPTTWRATARSMSRGRPTCARSRRTTANVVRRVVQLDHLLRPLPRSDVHVHRGGDRGRVARRTLRRPVAGCREHHGQPVLPRDERHSGYQVEHHLFPDMPSRPLRRGRAGRARHLPALRPAVQHAPVLLAACRVRAVARSCGSRSRAARCAPAPSAGGRHRAHARREGPPAARQQAAEEREEQTQPSS